MTQPADAYPQTIFDRGNGRRLPLLRKRREPVPPNPGPPPYNPHRVDGTELYALAIPIAYRDALGVAITAAESGLTLTTHAAIPILFLFRHALETYLKATLVMAGRAGDPVAPTTHTHELVPLWSDVRSWLLHRWPEEEESFAFAVLTQNVVLMHEIDARSMVFRYFDAPLALPESVLERTEGTWDLDAGVVREVSDYIFDYLEAIWEARKEELKSELPEWEFNPF